MVIQKLIVYALDIVMIIIIIDAVLSFIPRKFEHIAVYIIHAISGYFLRYARMLLPKKTDIGLDFSPLIAIVGIKVAQEIVIWFTELFI
jgi:uncharacterized protein YggT (Ycf19 family)